MDRAWPDLACTRDSVGEGAVAERAAGVEGPMPKRRDMAVNIVGLGLLVAGVIFMIIGGLVGWIVGVVCVIGGVGALFLTWQRSRRTAA